MEKELQKAADLIKSISSTEDAQELIDQTLRIDDAILKDELKRLDGTKEELASTGQSIKLSVLYRLLEEFNYNPDTRKYLHYFAQSLAVYASKNIKNMKDSQILESFEKIADSFTDANTIDQITSKK